MGEYRKKAYYRQKELHAKAMMWLEHRLSGEKCVCLCVLEEKG